MSTPFFITGLPRSRTAWLSVVATDNHGECWHEPASLFSSYVEMLNWWYAGKYRFRGVADSGLGMAIGQILGSRIPTVIIERDFADAVDSAHAYFGHEMSDAIVQRLARLQAELTKHRDHPLVKVVPYEALDDLTYVCCLLDWVKPDVQSFHDGNPDLLRPLMALNVQADRQFVMRKAAKPVREWWMDLAEA